MGLLAQFKSDRPPSFLLPDRCAIRRVSAGSDILYPDRDDITGTELAVDCQIEHGEIASARPSIWSFVRIDQTCLGRSGGFAPVSFPLFHGTRLDLGLAFTWSCMAILLGSLQRARSLCHRIRRWN
jgi:hypothetical protein